MLTQSYCLRFKFFISLICMAVFLVLHAERRREGTEWLAYRSYNANSNKLPRVLLIGDSICNGYHQQVVKKLAGTAYVTCYATSKCVSDKTYLREMDFVLGENDYAVIHFNNGLHSLSSDRKEWEAGLRAALDFLKAKGKGAKIIWATSTPLKDAQKTEKAKELNEIAAKVMKEYNIPTDDLFAAMDKLDRNKYWGDTYHFKSEAREMQAQQITSCVLAALGKKTASKEDREKELKASASETGPDGKISVGTPALDAIKNPGFEEKGHWTLYPNNSKRGTFIYSKENPQSGQAAIKIMAETKDIQFYQLGPGFDASTSYKVRFWARADKDSTLEFFIRTHKPPYKYYGKKKFNIGTDWKQYTAELKLPSDYEAKKHVIFFVTGNPGTFWLDNITAEKE